MLQAVEESHQSLCPMLPKALGIYAQGRRLKVLVVTGMSVRFDGHKYPCSRALFQNVTFDFSCVV